MSTAQPSVTDCRKVLPLKLDLGPDLINRKACCKTRCPITSQACCDITIHGILISWLTLQRVLLLEGTAIFLT